MIIELIPCIEEECFDTKDKTQDAPVQPELSGTEPSQGSRSVSEPKPAPCQSVFEYPDLFSIMHERKQQAKQGPSLRVRCTESASL